jgi:UDP-N-acetylglucosamine 4,6-dehydratase/5-epimerase
MFKGKVLLITGGTGSFGNAVLKRFLNTDIGEIRIFSRDEKKQDDMRKELKNQKVKFFIGDVRDYNSILSAMHGVDYIFHAAALKQVPSCEFFPMEAVKTNVIGTENVLTAAIFCDVQKVICLSTDKAVYPINAMGISKAMMEKAMVAKSRVASADKCVICGTRYGNVMASRGSVIPLFIQQIKAGEPLTVTDPYMTRYLMSLDDAVDLVLYAFEHGIPGDIFVQKASASTIADLAQALLEIFGVRNEIKTIGTRHGEKLYETLLTREEMVLAHDLGDYYRIPADTRDLNYDKYFIDGEQKISAIKDYNSHNTKRLNVAEIKDLLLKLDYIQQELKDYHYQLNMRQTAVGKSKEEKLMRTILITGANGFIGKNLVQHLKNLDNISLISYDIDDDINILKSGLTKADFVFHLAGVNRPQNENEFEIVNKGFTELVLEQLKRYNRKIPVVLTSSTQATLDNPYGLSKRQAEQVLFAWAEETGGQAIVYRLPNVFGKWCRPNYNSVVATFCHNIAHDLPIQIDNPLHEMMLVYIDDLIKEFLRALNGQPNKKDDGYCYVPQIFKTTVQDLADTIRSFQESRNTLILPNFEDGLTRFLYATYLSYLPEDGFGYPVPMKHDQRGWLTEIVKSKQFGQIFVSRTKPGITRGNHWHHTKVEKFIVIAGRAVIRFRQINGNKVIEVPVSDDKLNVVDIPTGYTHSIVNIGNTDLITLFWADELFDSNSPDTYFQEVITTHAEIESDDDHWNQAGDHSSLRVYQGVRQIL